MGLYKTNLGLLMANLVFSTQQKGVPFFDTPPPEKGVFHQGRGVGGRGGDSRPKTHWGVHLLDKIVILQGVQLAIPLGGKEGVVWRFLRYVGLCGFDLITSVR